MARQPINIGTNNNDGTGDNLRNAMTKINENFIELYQDSASNTNISITTNEIEVTNANGDLTLSPNGTGELIVSTGATFNTGNQPTGYFVVNDSVGGNVLKINPLYKNVGINTTANVAGLSVAGNATITGTTVNLLANVLLGDSDRYVAFTGKINSNTVPYANNLWDLGTTDFRYRTAYIANIQATTANITTVNSANLNSVNIVVTNETTVGNLVIRNNEISNAIVDEDIEIKPFGTGNVFVNTRVIIGSGPTPMVNPLLQITGIADNFTQVGVQNVNGGKFACSDFVVFSDNGSDFFNFVDIGQNNSGWDGTLQYVYFQTPSDADAWSVGNVIYQLDPSDGSSVLAQGIIDEKITNPANASEIRIRVSQVFTGTTGIFEEGSAAGLVYNNNTSTSAMPRDHILQTITSTGVATYDLGVDGTLNSSTAKAAFSPTVIMAPDSLVVKVNGVLKTPGIDYTVRFSEILFYNIPAVGATITLRQLPEANYPFTIGQAGDSYVYNNGSQLTIGTMTGHDMIFHINGIRWNDEVGRVKAATKNWIFGSNPTSTAGLQDTGEKVQVKGTLAVTKEIVQTNRVIASSVGSPGDKAGMIASDQDYFYKCIDDYDGSTAIWKRAGLSSW